MRTPTRNSILVGPLVLVPFLLGGCTSGGGGGGGGAVGLPGDLLAKPTGGDYFVDENEGGKTTRLEVIEILWGRLVDVYDVDVNGVPNAQPVFKDWVINENVQTDGTNYILDSNPITLATRLVILRQHRGVNQGNGTFESLLLAASSGLPPITAKHDNGTSPPPVSYMARNGVLMVRFNDVLNDSPAARADLGEAILVQTGYPPSTPYRPRMIFDANHGAVVKGKYHASRILIDMTVSDAEAAGTNLPVNTLGLPSSLSTSSAPNVSIRIPTRVDATSGQFKILKALSGVGLSPTTNGPVDTTVGSVPVVRGFRGGNVTDSNNGFLLDLNAPEVVGSWPITVDSAVADPVGKPGFDFLLDLTFGTVCQDFLDVGDTVSVGDVFLEVTQSTGAPNNSRILGVHARALVDIPVANPSNLIGSGSMLSTYDRSSNVSTGCWVTFAPQAGLPPGGEVSAASQVIVRFSEPMDPASATPFETFMLLRGASGANVIEAENVIVGTTAGSSDLKDFAFTPLLPLSHINGAAEAFNIRLLGVTDLAGNPLRDDLPRVDFTLDPLEPTVRNAGVALRFSDLDEVKPKDVFQGTFDDLRGQIFYDFERGVIKPRDVRFTSWAADRANPVPSIMIPFPLGIQTPLSALGSKLMTLWRYCDLGWNAADETKYNLDVYGLHWSPIGGLVQRDFFEQFEIRLAHSRYQPDEDIDNNLLPNYRLSGLLDGPSPFQDNILDDPVAGQQIVHAKPLGYVVDPADLHVNQNGTLLMPYPLNRLGSGPLTTYTWRDTRGTRTGGPSGAGVPLDIEGGPPLNLVSGADVGKLWGVNSVPTVGLPLLMEYRCYPSASGIGLNPLDISLAINSSRVPNFRCFSTGGVDTSQRPRNIFPDNEPAPTGGFNPTSNPPGKRTRFNADNSFYIGQLDVVTKVSRAHTVWIDALYASPKYLDPVMIPAPSDHPPGTQVLLDFRGATGFSAPVGDTAFDSGFINTYGDVVNTAKPPKALDITYLPNNRWQSSISRIDGARYFQMRITFVNDVDAGLNAELSAIGVAFLQ